MIFILQTMLTLLLASSVSLVIVFSIVIVYYRKKFYRMSEKRKEMNVLRIGVFHPYCNDGGGGERVLWTALRCILKKYPNDKISIYTGDIEYSPREILLKAKERFNIVLPLEINFVYLHRRKWIEAKMYPYFTLLGQSLGSVYLGMEALSAYQPDVFIDTMGYAFTYPLFKYLGHCKVASYTHYPTITSDMLKRVSGRVATYNNRLVVANSPFLTAGKLLYYKIFAWMYGWVGKSADVVMVNSSWTEQHINELWQRPLFTHCVYPPCDVDELKAIPRTENDTKEIIKMVSIGQFRPEKNHPLLLRAMYQLRQLLPEPVWDRVQLVLIGGCRNAEDKRRVRDMEDLCKHLSLENNVVFKLNISYQDLKKEFSEATIGLHAMWNEHFGIGKQYSILLKGTLNYSSQKLEVEGKLHLHKFVNAGVVECLAAGLITIAHRSGGPKSDIIIESEGSKNGFLAFDDDEYAHAMASVISMTPKQRENIIMSARSSVVRFSVEEFEKQFLRTVEPILKG